MCRIFTILFVLGFSGGISSSQAEQTQTSPDCQYSCACQACCAHAGISCNPLRDKEPVFSVGATVPANSAGDAAIAQ